MKFEDTGLEDLTIELARLDSIMEDIGLVRAGQWDYERVTYDRKLEAKGEIFYLRVQGYAVEGDVDTRYALIKLMTPLLGKHYYPHGVEYGEDEVFPAGIVDVSKKLLARVKEEVDKHQ
ncbi:YugN family protein [Metabacillus fastidiosus]|uniref:YugN family protein n=1 Tax=Metabacillus fastidiosus TaxID=1458 RepID=UPI002DBF8C1A|nr:YugN family protein [Metabacillus fastidiosus]MEC2074728.1 YugN family protein [Metabacillus fastidiosus]MED4532682.1 YugN family protein [Metabacillus fastidiosus]